MGKNEGHVGAKPKDWRTELERRVRGELLRDAPLASRTAVRVGGPADLLVRPADPEALGVLLRAVRELGLPLHVLGGGANTLVSDLGFRGVVVRLPHDFPGESAAGDTLVLSAGGPTTRLWSRGHALGLRGMEFIAGIPGSLGGCVAMNAGTKIGEMKDVVTRVELATADGAGFVDAAALAFGYRKANIPAGAVVTRVECRLRPADAAGLAESERLMLEDREKRRRTQPYDKPTFGSTFTNPPGDHAGRLIEAAGLKGHRIGHAVWSPVHANFVSNLGGATAADVLALMRLARARVKERFGVDLETEVRLVGEFAPEEIAGLAHTG
jgi:UDP-N-acetylmuramate dehydrogenase